MKKSIFSVLLAIFLLVALCVPVFAEGTVEKAEAYDELMANQERLENSAAAKKGAPSFTVKYGARTRPAISGKQIASCGVPYPAMIGYKIMEKGGTAFDAAVAMAAVHGIVEDPMCNIFGGDAMIIIYNAEEGKCYTYNGTGWAPNFATVEYYLDNVGSMPSSTVFSIELPGEWSAWMKLLQDYGTMPLEEILQPMLSAAEDGLFVDDVFAQTCRSGATAKNGNEALKKMFTKEDGTPYQVGDVWTCPELASTIRALIDASKKGSTNKEGYKLAEDYFYRGPIAEAMVEWFNANGAPWVLDDFNSFEATKVDTWKTDFRGYEINVCPPNSQGPAIIESLNILENFDLDNIAFNSAEYIDLLAQTFNIALNDRNNNFGDPRFIKNNEYIVSKEYAKEMASYIKQGTAAEEIPQIYAWEGYDEKGSDTAYFYVADKYGNVVSCTHSLCNPFGSQLAVDNLGIVFNNRMMYFTLDDEKPNHVEPHKRTMQTITPMIGVKDGRAAFCAGTPGADNQAQEITETILAALVYGVTNPQSVTEIPRFVTNAPAGLMNPVTHPKQITLDPGTWLSDEEIFKLEDMGYTLKFGSAKSIGFAWFYENGYKYGGHDPRRNGYVVAGE